jgi:hypothetical protein
MHPFMCCRLHCRSPSTVSFSIWGSSAVLIRRRRCRDSTYANGKTIGTWLDLAFSLVVAEDLSPCPISIAGAAFPGLGARCSFPRHATEPDFQRLALDRAPRPSKGRTSCKNAGVDTQLANSAAALAARSGPRFGACLFLCLPVTRIWPLLFLHYRNNAS